MLLNLSQRTALAVIPKVTAGLSVLCSLIIVCLVLRDNKRRSKVFHRLIFGLSLTDAITSSWWVMSTWPIPKDSGVLWAVGSTTSCTIQGFFLQLGIANPLYCLSVSVYYLMAVHFAWGEDKLRRIEHFFHLGPLGWGLSTAIIGLPLKIFNNAGLWCWIADFPGRNENTEPFRWGIFYAPLWLAFVLVTVCLSKLVIYFQRVTMTSERNMARDQDPEANLRRTQQTVPESRESAMTEGHDEEDLDTEMDEAEMDETEMDEEELCNETVTILPQTASGRSRFAAERRRLAWHCLRYALVFYITWFPITFLRILQAVGQPVPYALILLAAILTPLQGLPNFLAYLYPLLLKKLRKLKSRCSNAWAPCCPLGSVDVTEEAADNGGKIPLEDPEAQREHMPLSRKSIGTKFQRFFVRKNVIESLSSIWMSDFAASEAHLAPPEARWKGIGLKPPSPGGLPAKPVRRDSENQTMLDSFECPQCGCVLQRHSDRTAGPGVELGSEMGGQPSIPDDVKEERLAFPIPASSNSSRDSNDFKPSRPVRFISEADESLQTISEGDSLEWDEVFDKHSSSNESDSKPFYPVRRISIKGVGEVGEDHVATSEDALEGNLQNETEARASNPKHFTSEVCFVITKIPPPLQGLVRVNSADSNPARPVRLASEAEDSIEGAIMQPPPPAFGRSGSRDSIPNRPLRFASSEVVTEYEV